MTTIGRTWDWKMLILIIGIAIAYGVWFDYLDSLRYPRIPISDPSVCPSSTEDLIKIGTMLGSYYQVWNIIGHTLPTLFLALYKRGKLEYAIAGTLISTLVMDTPVWGAEVLYLHPNQCLWKDVHGDVPTRNLWEWVKFYYNPLGNYGVWEYDGFPYASVMFWSLIGRAAAASVLIIYQNRKEKSKGKQFSFGILEKKLGIHAAEFTQDLSQ